MKRAHSTPIAAETRWPPSSAHGCDIGLWKTANSSTAEEPIDATTNERCSGCASSWLAQIIAAIAAKAASAEIIFSRPLIAACSGKSLQQGFQSAWRLPAWKTAS